MVYKSCLLSLYLMQGQKPAEIQLAASVTWQKTAGRQRCPACFPGTAKSVSAVVTTGKNIVKISYCYKLTFQRWAVNLWWPEFKQKNSFSPLSHDLLPSVTCNHVSTTHVHHHMWAVISRPFFNWNTLRLYRVISRVIIRPASVRIAAVQMRSLCVAGVARVVVRASTAVVCRLTGVLEKNSFVGVVLTAA